MAGQPHLKQREQTLIGDSSAPTVKNDAIHQKWDELVIQPLTPTQHQCLQLKPAIVQIWIRVLSNSEGLPFRANVGKLAAIGRVQVLTPVACNEAHQMLERCLCCRE